MHLWRVRFPPIPPTLYDLEVIPAEDAACYDSASDHITLYFDAETEYNYYTRGTSESDDEKFYSRFSKTEALSK